MLLGNCSELDAPCLLESLGKFYDSATARVTDNGNDFDEDLNNLGSNSAPKIWDEINKRLLTTEEREISTFQNQLRFPHLSWYLWHLDSLDKYGKKITLLALETEGYLKTSEVDMQGSKSTAIDLNLSNDGFEQFTYPVDTNLCNLNESQLCCCAVIDSQFSEQCCLR